jgi:enamine deaminase RidA (YjgF/YER057c/UK114 family)
MPIEQRLAALGLHLPQPPKAVGNYQPWIRTGHLIFVSGQFPLVNGVLKYSGKLGSDLSNVDGYDAAKFAALNVLAQLYVATRQFEDLDSIVRLDGHINCTPDWIDQAKVLDGASDLFAQVLESRAGHARTAFGQTALPLNAPVELVVLAATRQH